VSVKDKTQYVAFVQNAKDAVSFDNELHETGLTQKQLGHGDYTVRKGRPTPHTSKQDTLAISHTPTTNSVSTINGMKQSRHGAAH
jgi:hypothetical protein